MLLRDGTGVPIQAFPRASHGTKEEARVGQWREVGLGTQILKDLGISSICLLASARLNYVGLGGFGIEIAGTEMLEN